PWSDGTTGIKLSPLELLEKLAALVPLPHVHLVRYGGCLAPHSHLRGSVIPTPRQQGMEEQEATITAPHWSWARLLHRVGALVQPGEKKIPFCVCHSWAIMTPDAQTTLLQRRGVGYAWPQASCRATLRRGAPHTAHDDPCAQDTATPEFPRSGDSSLGGGT